MSSKNSNVSSKNSDVNPNMELYIKTHGDCLYYNTDEEGRLVSDPEQKCIFPWNLGIWAKTPKDISLLEQAKFNQIKMNNNRNFLIYNEKIMERRKDIIEAITTHKLHLVAFLMKDIEHCENEIKKINFV